MKPASHAFRSQFTSGRCPVCKKNIVKGDLIVRLEATETWIEESRNAYGKAYLKFCCADYAHAECMEDKDETIE